MALKVICFCLLFVVLILTHLLCRTYILSMQSSGSPTFLFFGLQKCMTDKIKCIGRSVVIYTNPSECLSQKTITHSGTRDIVACFVGPRRHPAAEVGIIPESRRHSSIDPPRIALRFRTAHQTGDSRHEFGARKGRFPANSLARLPSSLVDLPCAPSHDLAT